MQNIGKKLIEKSMPQKLHKLFDQKKNLHFTFFPNIYLVKMQKYSEKKFNHLTLQKSKLNVFKNEIFEH